MRGKTPNIIKLYEQGMNAAAIAREVQCTLPNVCQTIKRFKLWRGKVKPLRADHHNWLLDTAERQRISPAALATKLLEEAIETYRGKK